MANRHLYIAAYDIAHPKRLRKVHIAVKSYATGGQKSAYECFLTPAEREGLIVEVRTLFDDNEDRFALLRVEERAKPILKGIALPAVDPNFYYVG